MADATAEPPTPFPNYLAMSTRLPIAAWRAIRFVSVIAFVAIAIVAMAGSDDVLVVFWGLLVPVLPLVFLIAPGVWRNVCPLAGVNQASREFGVARGRTAPAWLAERGFAIATTLFVGAVLARKIWLNHNGLATGAVILAALSGAALGGYVFKGKSGWCSSICPVLPVQRVYGQTPFVGVANAHCRPCLGCTKNCYDFNPRVAYVADMYDGDPVFRGPRRLFVGAFPGLVQAFFVVPDVGTIGVAEMAGRMGLWVAASVAVFVVLDTYLALPANRLPVLFGGIAFVTFYFHSAPRMAAALERLVGGEWSAIVWPLRAAALVLATVWFARSVLVERRFLAENQPATAVKVDLRKARTAVEGDDGVEVVFDEIAVVVRRGITLLEAAESAGAPIESGCRQGVCGADPVAVLDGGEHLSPVRREESDTLSRLGLGEPNRMACMARLDGPCVVATRPDTSARAAAPSAPTFVPDASVERVVVLGNGVAGVTTADFLRRLHGDCAIDLVGAEPHHLYNRMGIARVVVGRSAMQGLYLLPDRWYEDNRVTTWLNTRAVRIDREARTVRLGIREELPYDRLVLAIGARATAPPIEGFGMHGTFVLRDAADAVALRAELQTLERPRAIVAGGGLLGLEAAHALHALGVDVLVGERSDRLLRRGLDERSSELLRSYFESLGIEIRTEIEIAEVLGDERVHNVRTVAGELLDVDIVVAAAGITPNADLALEAGIEVARGVVVDDRMTTSDPNVLAVGDVAEFEGRTWGLWPVAVKQARVAASTIAGGDERYLDEVPKMVLKGCGLDMVSFGRIEPSDGDVVIVDQEPLRHLYRKIVLRDGAVVGGVFLGHDPDAVAAEEAAASQRHFTDDELARVRARDWTPLTTPALATAARS